MVLLLLQLLCLNVVGETMEITSVRLARITKREATSERHQSVPNPGDLSLTFPIQP